jgi:hypothetical protein
VRREGLTVADEIELCNVLRVERIGPSLWRATLGLDPERGLSITAFNATSAILAVACRAARLGWVFDESWSDRLLDSLRRDAAPIGSGGPEHNG